MGRGAIRRASGVGAPGHQVVAGGLDLHLVLGAADDHRLAENVLADDGAVALHRLDPRADRGQRLPELDVGLVLVAETALEPPAHARELGGVQREALLLRHLDRDGLELLEPRRAAELPPAWSDAAGHLGLVARAD